ncbi:bromodomain-containing protein 8 isoform X2 [Sceloporus undulatus]|uniref:bromodomain-containing protein 8 isoform X2 n=1 Tax=Sceloporus undulatus TaxID=8520 RepID=UPI001C4C0E25|nr:bromodomain-containing protein 8 isoform X2 [Sceloporus undulatus]
MSRLPRLNEQNTKSFPTTLFEEKWVTVLKCPSLFSRVSVSRAIKPFAEPGRPPDWFSQKHCASQYSELLETTETPKRKRGEKGEVVETVEDVIVRKLTAERVEELKKMIKETQEKYRQLKRDAELIQAGHMDHKLEELYNDIVVKKKMEEEEAEVKRKATDAAYQARQAVKNPSRRVSGMMVRSPAGSTSPGADYSLGDLSQASVEEASPGVTPGTLPSTPVASFIGIPDTPMGSTSLDAPMTPVTDDSAQKKMLGQKATPPPSPLLSELLKKGSLLPTSPRLVGESDMSVVSGHTSSSGILLDVGGVIPVLHGGEIQSASTVPASPAASGAPTLSRLLEAGPTQFTTTLASFSAVASEPPAKLLPPPVESVSQATLVMVPTLQAPAAVPPAATPESVATVNQPSTCVSMEPVPDPHTVTVSMDSSEISMIIDSIKKDCLGSGASGAVGTSKDHSMDGKEDLDLAEKMDVAVSYTGEEPSYTGEELDFETVGDIIAIIEDKVDDHPEVLDVAAVEAALSFCEEIEDPQSLTGPWEHPLQPEHEKQSQIPPMPVTVKQERPDCEEPEAKGIRDLMSIGDLGVEIKNEPTEQGHIHLSSEEASAARSSEASELRGQISDEETAVAGLEGSEMEMEASKDEMDHGTVKTELPADDETSSPHAPSANEDSSQADLHHKYELSESMKEEAQALFENQLKGEEDEEDGASEAASLEEPKEEDQGEEYLSEMDNEPPVSESDDGFSIHNAPLQSHTLADSIPSSPASSQFSVCSEDQEAIQAQKIWKKAIMLVWRAAANHRYANVFLQPVTDDIAPGYHSIVQRPMDLSTIKKNIENGLIRTTAEFQRDIMLMFQNAVMYNSSDHDVYHMAVEMQRDVLEQIQQFLATQLIMQTSESGISAKSLRGRDSTRKQDASEKMGHVWTWLESKEEFFTDSEESSNCQSFCGSLDSSLDLELELRSWRETGETTQEDSEESNSQEESEMDDSEACEKASAKEQEEERTYKQEAVLRFLSEVTHLMEPLCIGDTNLVQGPQALGATGEENGNGALIQKEDSNKSLVHTEEEVEEESQPQIFKKQFRENIAPQRKGNCPFQVSNSLPLISWQADRMEEHKDFYEQPKNSQIQNSKFDENLGKTVLHILEEGVEEMEDEHSYSENMTQTSCNWRPLKEEIPPTVKEEAAVENSEEQVEDWKDSDFHLSYSNDDSSPWGTPLMSSPSTSTASLPLMQLNEDDSLQQRLLFKKTLLSIWKMVAGHRYSGPFLKAVSEKQAPGYKDVVKRPVDLSSIKRSLSKGQIQNMIQFQRDLMLMFQNAVMYNSSNHHIHRIAVEMQREVLEQLQMLGEALLCSEETQDFLRWC